MTTSTDQTATGAESLPEERRDRTARRLLKALLAILLIAALGLAGLLVWLLRPEPEPKPPGQAAGYPIHVVATIYGFGTDAADQIRTPLGVTFDSQGNVWVSDTGRSRVEEYTADGGFVQAFGQDKGPGQLYSPYGIAVDTSRDQVYVADYGSRAVQVYSTSGQYVTHFPADDQDLSVFGPDGFSPFDVQIVDGRVVVSSNDGLYFFDTEGHVVARWGATIKGENVRGVDTGMFNFPDSFVADPNTGRIYVADTLNRRIVALDANGRWLWTSGRPDASGKIRGFWQLPRGIQIGPDGNIYVIDTFRYDPKGMGIGHVVVLSPDGQLLSEFGRGGSDDGAFEFPEQLAFNGSDLWAVADRENHRVVIFRLTTPYPDVSPLETPKYRKMLQHPKSVFATPAPAKPVS